jgi:hypothetical protein
LGVGELLAVTTTTMAQTTRSGSSGIWVPLLAALLGALVGGVATLTGSVLVKRWELRKTTRIRMYDELLPALFEQYRRIVMTMRYFSERGELSPTPPRMDLIEDAGELRRAGVIAGGREAQITERIWTLLRERTAYVVGIGGTTLRWEPDEPEAIRAVYEELESLVDSLHKHLERKLTSRYRRRLRGDGSG